MPGTSRKRVEVVANTPTNLTCNAPNGRPAANVTWYQNNVPAEGETYSFINKKDKMENATGNSVFDRLTAVGCYDGDKMVA